MGVWVHQQGGDGTVGRLVMFLDHVITRDVTVSTSTRIERKVAMSGWVIVEIWQLPAPGLSEEALGADE